MPQRVGVGFSYLLHMAFSPASLPVHDSALLGCWPPRSLPRASPASTTASCPDHRNALPKASVPFLALPHRSSSFSNSIPHRALFPRLLLVPPSLKLPSDFASDARCSICSCASALSPKACAWSAVTSLLDSRNNHIRHNRNSLRDPLNSHIAHNYC